MRRDVMLVLSALVAVLLVPPATAGADHTDLRLDRVAGHDRVATAVEVARIVHETATTAVLARADGFADALSGVPLATAVGGPLLLTRGDQLSVEVAEELSRLQTRRVLILGGTAAVSRSVEATLADDHEVERISGRDRYATAAAIALRRASARRVYVATGASFPDALSVGPLASWLDAPILLTAPGALPDATRDALETLDPSEVVVIGGRAAVADPVLEELATIAPTVRRMAGATRYGTSAAVFDAAVAAGMDAGTIWLATGGDFPDALAGGPAVARTGGTLMLVDGGDLGESGPVATRLAERSGDVRRIRLLGGPAAITGLAPRQLDAVLHANLLPRGGTEVFARQRLIAFYGNADSPRMGVLGETTPDDAARRLEAQATPYARPGRRILPTFELIVQVATSGPGPDGDYSAPGDPEDIQRYLDAARRHGVYLLLDVQPGRSDFPSQVRRYERFLREPDVGLALDPEWRMEQDEVPGETIGSVHADEVNEVVRYLSTLVREEHLPEKLLVIHQFRHDMIDERERIEHPDELAVTIHVDGFGSRSQKLATYGALALTDGSYDNGFKLFYDEDTDLFQPDDVLRLSPVPDLVSYQ